MTEKKGIFYGWWVVVALFFICGLGPMGRYSLTALAPFIQEDLLFTKSQIGMAFSIHMWAYGPITLLVGWMIDHIGSRRTILIGGAILLVALILLSRLETLVQLYLFFGIIACFGVGMTHFVIGQATSRKWFIKRAGLAAGLITAAFGVGTGILSPVLTQTAASVGWRSTLFVCAFIFGIVIMLLAALVIRDTPESMGLHPDGIEPQQEVNENMNSGKVIDEVAWPIRKALRTSQFWLLFMAFICYSIPVQGMLTQVVLWGVDLGAPLATAGIFMTTFTLPSIGFKILGGWMGDRWGKKRFLIISNAICMLAMAAAWLVVDSTSSLIAISILMGVGYGIAVPLFSTFLADLYGRASLGTLLGIQVFGAGGMSAFGPLIWGWIADTTGTYNLACLLSAILYAIAIILFVLIKPAKLVRPDEATMPG